MRFSRQKPRSLRMCGDSGVLAEAAGRGKARARGRPEFAPSARPSGIAGGPFRRGSVANFSVTADVARVTGIFAGEPFMFKGRHFDRSVILLCVRWYLAYGLSL